MSDLDEYEESITYPKKRVGGSQYGATAKKSVSFTSGLNASQLDPEDKEMSADGYSDIKVPEIRGKIEELVITSKHYTSRDKQEIAAQLPVWKAYEVIKSTKNTSTGGDITEAVSACVAMKRQMVLY